MTKHAYLLVLAAGCEFTASRSVSVDGAIPGGGVSGGWTFDSAAELGAAGHVTRDMTIEARGSLTPNAYTYGGLVAHGYQNLELWQHGTTSWTLLGGKTPSGAGLWRGERLTDAAGFNNNLNYFGISDPKSMTVAFEGEVWLEASSAAMFQLNGDDVSFFQIAAPGTVDYSAVSDSNNVAVPVATPTTGWYPIRIGHTNGNSGNNFEFTHSELAGPLRPWTRERLRARTSELSGAMRIVFGRQLLGGGQALTNEVMQPISSFEKSALLVLTTFPAALPGAGNDDWSARYVGQVYVTQPGSYTLDITSDDGSRARLGVAGRDESHWVRGDKTGSATPAATANLVAGWNDLSVDYNQVTGPKFLRIQLDGPDFAKVEVLADHLRPVESSDDRLAVGSDETPHPVPDGGGAPNPGTASILVAGSTGETVTSIDVTFEVDSPHWDQLKVDLETPGATRTMIRNTVNGLPDGDQVAEVTVPLGAPPTLGTPGVLLGGPVNGVWKLHVYDALTTTGGAITLKSAKLTLHTTGGPDKVARTASWTSPVLDGQTNVFAIDGATWDERVPDGATLEVHVRTCQQANCSDDPAWPPPVAKATPFAVTAGRYVQLRVDMTSNGVLEPELRSLSVMYRHDAGS